MRQWLRSNMSYANVMSSIAVFAVLAGGGAWAATKIGAGDIKRNAIHSKHIKSKAVTRAKLATPTLFGNFHGDDGSLARGKGIVEPAQRHRLLRGSLQPEHPQVHAASRTVEHERH